MHEEPNYEEVVCRNGNPTDLMYHKAVYKSADAHFPPIFCTSCYCENTDCVRNRRNPFRKEARKTMLQDYNEQHPFAHMANIYVPEKGFEYYCLDYEEHNREWD